MTSLLIDTLENETKRYNNLLSTGRKDAIASLLLGRLQQEINRLTNKVKNEKEPRQEVDSRTSSGRASRRFREALHRYGIKCYGDNHAIPSLLEIQTL